MTTTMRLTAIALAALMTGAGPALAADPNGSTPSASGDPRGGAPASAVPQPSLPPGRTSIGIERHIPPPPPPTDLSAAQDAEVDALIGLVLILGPSPGPGSGGPQNLASSGGPGWSALLDEECEWQSGGFSKCVVWDTDDPELVYGEYCVGDNDGQVIPCP